jgi:hypothetical protein
MKIEPKKKYRIKGTSEYFKEKYGTSNPIIEIEDSFFDMNKDGKSIDEKCMESHPACTLYARRCVEEDLPLDPEEDKNVYYGKIEAKGGFRFGELVHESELLEI